MTTITQTIRTSLILVAAAAMLAACSGKSDPNSFGGRLALEGGEVAAIGEDWNAAQAEAAEGRELIEDGNAQIKKGEKLVAKGEGNIDDGQTKIRRGERMISDGERKAAEVEKRYNARIAASAVRLKSTN